MSAQAEPFGVSLHPGKTTSAQMGMLDTIERFIGLRGFAPTVRELMALTGQRSTNGVNELIERLVKSRLLSREANKARTLKVTASGIAALKEWRS